MARIDIVAAHPLETAWLRAELGCEEHSPGIWQKPGSELRVLHTGVGSVNAAFFLGKEFSAQPPELAIQVGIAGCFDRDFDLTDVVEVVADQFADLGADSPAGFLGMEQMGLYLWEKDGTQWYNRIVNPGPSDAPLEKVEGITVNTVSGEAQAIARLRQRVPQATVETMESAAFFYACLRTGTPFYAFRSISNYVEPRNRGGWKIREAAQAVQQQVFDYFRLSLK